MKSEKYQEIIRKQKAGGIDEKQEEVKKETKETKVENKRQSKRLQKL